MKGISGKRYGQTILDTRRSFSIIKTPFSTYFPGGSSTLRRRLKAVLDTQPKPIGVCPLILTIVLSLVLGDLVALAISAMIGDLAHLPLIQMENSTPSSSVSEPAVVPPSSSEPAVVAPPASSAGASSDAASSASASSDAASSASASSDATSSAGASSDATSSAGASSSSAPEIVTKDPNVIPEKRFFLPVVEQIITAYRDGTADTSMLDPTKPVLMPVPASAQNPPEVPTDTNFTVMRNAQGFGIVIPFDDNAWTMNIWVRDDGPENAYVFIVTAVSFTQGSRRTASASLVADPAQPSSVSSSAASSQASSASSKNAASSYAAAKEAQLSPFKRSSSGLLS